MYKKSIQVLSIDQIAGIIWYDMISGWISNFVTFQLWLICVVVV